MKTQISLDDVWKKVLAQIEIKLDSPRHYKTWFSYTKLVELKDNKAIIGTHNSFNADFLMKKHKVLINETLSYVYGSDLNIKIEYREECAKIAEEMREGQSNVKKAIEDLPLMNQNTAGKDIFTKLRQSNVNPKYTFETFIVGDSNRLAHAAALAIADNPGNSYNPLYLHGNTGLGKTHLAQSIARSIIEKDLSKKILYSPSETFLNDLVSAIRTNKTGEFRTKYRELDLFIIDDIQLISNWIETQSEFFNTFNALMQANKQIILISDRPVEEIKNLEDRLKSRFLGGLVSDVKLPELETRIAILEQKQKELKTNLSQTTLRFIAQVCNSSVRELEGAVQKISLLQKLKPDHEMTYEEVANILGKSIEDKRKLVKVADIIKKVATEFHLKASDLKGEKRTKDIAFARQVCMYILREEYKYKLEKVAELLNRSDHTTVLHGVEKIKENYMKDILLKKQIEGIIQDLEN